MAPEMMTHERFTQLLSAYGTRWNAWPEAEREAGRVLLAGNAHLQALWNDESQLDALLHAVPTTVASANLRENVIAAAAVAGIRERKQFRGAWAWLSGAGVAATAFAGAAFGVLIAHQINESRHADEVLYQASLNAADDTEMLGVEMASLNMGGR